jgi:predicted glutamine amidotransferase
MCLIVVKPAGQDIPQNVIVSAQEYNSDGFGIMHNGTSRRWKHRTAAQITSLLEDMTDIDCAVHFRMATDGKVCVANSHPFKLRNDAYLMHNGILSKYRTSGKANKSDTRTFIDKFCNPLISKHGSIPRNELENEIYGNAIAIMQKDGTINTYGSSWLERYGCKFSNTYAWDSGESWKSYSSIYNNSSYSSSKTRDSIDTPVDMGDSGTYGLLGTIYYRLYEIADMLPVQDYSYVAYEDLDLQDSLIADEIDCYKFLNQCTEETLLELYTYACNQALI